MRPKPYYGINRAIRVDAAGGGTFGTDRLFEPAR
jgi:hypothetical protein